MKDFKTVKILLGFNTTNSSLILAGQHSDNEQFLCHCCLVHKALKNIIWQTYNGILKKESTNNLSCKTTHLISTYMKLWICKKFLQGWGITWYSIQMKQKSQQDVKLIKTTWNNNKPRHDSFTNTINQTIMTCSQKQWVKSQYDYPADRKENKSTRNRINLSRYI